MQNVIQDGLKGDGRPLLPLRQPRCDEQLTLGIPAFIFFFTLESLSGHSNWKVSYVLRIIKFKNKQDNYIKEDSVSYMYEIYISNEKKYLSLHLVEGLPERG